MNIERDFAVDAVGEIIRTGEVAWRCNGGPVKIEKIVDDGDLDPLVHYVMDSWVPGEVVRNLAPPSSFTRRERVPAQEWIF